MSSSKKKKEKNAPSKTEVILKETDEKYKDKDKVKADFKRPEFFESIKGAVIDPSMFDKFRRLNLKQAAAFIAVFILLITILYTLKWALMEAQLIDITAACYEGSLPEMKVQKGKLIIPDHIILPKQAQYQQNGKSIIITIDTSNAGESAGIDHITGFDRVYLITETHLIYSIKDGASNTVPLDKLSEEDFTISGSSIRKLKTVLIPNLFPVMLLTWFLYRALLISIQTPFFAFAAFMMSKSMKYAVSFKDAVNIALYASVPPTVLLAVFDLSGLGSIQISRFSGQTLRIVITVLYYLILLIYIIRALKAVEKINAKE